MYNKGKHYQSSLTRRTSLVAARNERIAEELMLRNVSRLPK